MDEERQPGNEEDMSPDATVERNPKREGINPL